MQTHANIVLYLNLILVICFLIFNYVFVYMLC